MEISFEFIKILFFLKIVFHCSISWERNSLYASSSEDVANYCIAPTIEAPNFELAPLLN